MVYRHLIPCCSAVPVVILPDCQSLVDMAGRSEQRLVEQLVAQSPLEALDEGVPTTLAQAHLPGSPPEKERAARMKAAAAAV
jgi:hypothetical protein